MLADDAQLPAGFRRSHKTGRRKIWELGYDPTRFTPHDVQRKGSCCYESLSDGLNGDGGSAWAAVKRKLLASLVALPVDERPTFAAAIAGADAPEDLANDATVCSLDSFALSICSLDSFGLTVACAVVGVRAIHYELESNGPTMSSWRWFPARLLT